MQQQLVSILKRLFQWIWHPSRINKTQKKPHDEPILVTFLESIFVTIWIKRLLLCRRQPTGRWIRIVANATSRFSLICSCVAKRVYTYGLAQPTIHILPLQHTCHEERTSITFNAVQPFKLLENPRFHCHHFLNLLLTKRCFTSLSHTHLNHIPHCKTIISSQPQVACRHNNYVVLVHCADCHAHTTAVPKHHCLESITKVNDGLAHGLFWIKAHRPRERQLSENGQAAGNAATMDIDDDSSMVWMQQLGQIEQESICTTDISFIVNMSFWVVGPQLSVSHGFPQWPTY